MAKKDVLVENFDFRCMNSAGLVDLKEMVDKYPYCQLVQLLFLLNLKKISDPSYDQYFDMISLSLPDRQRLKAHLAEIEKMIFLPESTVKLNRLELEMSEQTRKAPKAQKISQVDRFEALENFTISSMLFAKEDTEASSQTKKSQAVKNARARLNAISHGITESTEEFKEETKVNKASLKKKVKTVKKARPHELSKEDLIERFLAKPSHSLIAPDNDKDYSYDADISKSLREDSSYATETLAYLLLNQGAIDKAVEMFKQLSLKYPEKSKIFAKEIRDTKKKQTNIKKTK